MSEAPSSQRLARTAMARLSNGGKTTTTSAAGFVQAIQALSR